jgi:hypothetical protein
MSRSFRPLIPAKVGTQAAGVRLRAVGIVADSAWVPAFAAMSGNP